MTIELVSQIVNRCQLTGTFVLRSGQTSREYFDKYQFESDPILLRQIAEAMLPLIPPTADTLAGLEMGGIPIATTLSAMSGLPVVFVRKHAKAYGTCKVIEGVSVAAREVCIIEDVVTTGGQIGLSSEDLRLAGATVKTVLCVIQRDAAATAYLAQYGLRLVSLIHAYDYRT